MNYPSWHESSISRPGKWLAKTVISRPDLRALVPGYESVVPAANRFGEAAIEQNARQKGNNEALPRDPSGAFGVSGPAT